jgi:hypothetical protein
LPTALFAGAGFKGKALPGRIILGWRRVADQATEIKEMFLGRGAFFQRNRAPFGDKFLGRHKLSF